ncbi:uncharacterized protein PGTG_21534 [Puccinia graminis f. sp. tritici CRL 75-36-700-3]|uniref:Lysophospholipase n=1 Tax=Puccinia graminis f. sp. tritici (strain CRL 75-36-700-3 / race SCCL) TaxID=418459 RepID=H6QRR1_PUCGT|nr:uncharacterized protein PGTG_21534 [Puccinia graminis f. sp. tritici CRL 75-36-700-3]EHS63358.1 hypothetical protein PGTG_21534 [Puccinia graminis f. sp. tritici CRL 75-36-700-3]
MISLLLIMLISSWTPAGSMSDHRRRDLAIEASPSGGYEPIVVRCPANFTIRVAGTDSDFLGQKEADYIAQKAAKSTDLWQTYLAGVGLADFDLANFTTSNPVAGETVPNIGIAMSGGGIRALIGGAGILDAFDNRNPEAVNAGTGGILQLANYITGLSGGSWLLGSWATSNFPRFTALNQTVWRLTEPSSYTSWNSVKRYPKAISQAKRKSKSGFPTSLVDVQSYILSRHLINDTHHGSKVLFSSIRNTTEYLNRQAPFPILLCTSRVNGVSEINSDTPIYEFNPEEFGVCHPTLKAFIPLEDLGSRMEAGKPAREDSCVQGFDNAGFVIGASSNVLSQPGFRKFSWKNILPEAYDKITNHIYDEAIVPNPFYHMGMGPINGSGYPERESKNLYLADGGWGGEILPFWPLLQPDRKLDAIIAIDFSADGPSMYHGAYPNGTSLFNTYKKTQEDAYKNIHFPKIPEIDGPFTEKGLAKKPSFFGCHDQLAPIVIYLPNYFVVTDTNQATMKAEYSQGEIDAFFKNSFAIATQTRPGKESNSFQYDNDSIQTLLGRAGPITHTRWKECLACALVDRQVTRNKMQRSPQCQRCFAKYCA